jgi:hypothetical protein
MFLYVKVLCFGCFAKCQQWCCDGFSYNYSGFYGNNKMRIIPICLILNIVPFSTFAKNFMSFYTMYLINITRF